MLSVGQILLVLGIIVFLGFGPKLLRRVLAVKKGLKEGAEHLKSSLDGTDEKEVQGEVIQSKIHDDENSKEKKS